MPIIAVIELVFQVYFIVHAIRNNKEYFWIFIILFFPIIGCMVYFFVEYLPELQTKQYSGRYSKTKMRLSDLKDQVELSPSLKNKKALAEGYINKGYFDKAIVLYESCLEGLHEDDQSIIEGLCCAYFFKGDLGNAKSHLIKLKEIRTDNHSDEFDLLLARTYEGLGDTENAIKEYTELIKSFTGEEARCRYALLLKQIGRGNEADDLFNEIVKNARLSPKYYRKRQKKWINIASKHAR